MEGEHGREAKGKLPVLDLSKRSGKGREKLIPNAALATPMSITRKKSLDSIIYTDCRSGYNAPDVSEFRYCRVSHLLLFADGENHNDGIKNFWNLDKHHPCTGMMALQGLAFRHT